jgi:DNA-binding transcriptional ArsR family regulator
MIELVLAHADLARIRFAHSPTRELVSCLRTLQSPHSRQVYGKWLSAAEGHLTSLNMDLLTALIPAGPYVCDFLMPEVAGASGILTDELDAVAATPPDAVRDDLEALVRNGPVPIALRPLYDDPARHLPAVMDQLYKYWRAVVEPYWEQVRATATTDVSYRMQQFAAGGVANVIRNLHPEVGFDEDRIRIDKAHHCSHRLDAVGVGVVLVPCVFGWPTLVIQCCRVRQTSINYPARGAAAIGVDSRMRPANPLFALVGKTRARLIAALASPKTTTQLARELNITPPAVSQHLKMLKAAEMAVACRQGRIVLYQRTPAATALLSSQGRGLEDEV